MKYALKAGLRLISGETPPRQHEVVRLLPDGEVQLEDVLTRRPRVMKESELVRQVFSGRLVPMTLSQEMRGSKEVREVTCQGLPTVDLSAIRPDWLEQINYRLRYVKGMQKAHLNGCARTRLAKMIRTVASEVNDPSPPSTSTVLAWGRRLRQNDMNPLALLSGNKSRTVIRRFPEAVETLIAQTLKEEYFTKSRYTLRHAHSRLKNALQIAVRDGTVALDDASVSLATLSRRVKDTDVYYRIASREGEGRARMLTRTTMDGTVASYPLQKVEVDHTPLDWVVICDDTGLPLGRPWLTVVIDAYSGYVLGFYLSFYAPGVSSVVGALRNSIEPKDELIKRLGLSTPWLSHGLADEWVLDNGMEFHSRAFQQIMWTLGTDVSYCRVRTPWLKPHVERFFGELNSLTLARGRVHKSMANAVRMDPYKDASVGFGDLVKGLTMFVTEGHALKINQRTLSRPIDLFREGLERCPPAVYPGSVENLRVVSGMSQHLVVGPGGLELHGIPYGRAELLPWRKELGERFKAFVKWDPDDMGALHVQHPLRATEWLRCPTRWPDYAEGLSFNQHRLIRKFARERLKESGALEELQAARVSLHDHWMNAGRPTTRKSSMTAARAAGITSAGAFNPAVRKSGNAPPPPAEPKIILDDRIEPPFDDDIPDFGGFELGND